MGHDITRVSTTGIARRFGVATLLTIGLTVGALAISTSAVGASMGATKSASRSTPGHVGATSKKVAFSARYSGTVTMVINGSTGAVAVSSITGTGSAAIIGKGTVAGTGSAQASDAACPTPFPLQGTGHITGPGGKITFRVLSSKSTGCSSGTSGAVTVTFHGAALITSATGKAKGLTGTVAFHGSFPLAGTSGKQSGKFTASLTGVLTKKA